MTWRSLKQCETPTTKRTLRKRTLLNQISSSGLVPLYERFQIVAQALIFRLSIFRLLCRQRGPLGPGLAVHFQPRPSQYRRSAWQAGWGRGGVWDYWTFIWTVD